MQITDYPWAKFLEATLRRFVDYDVTKVIVIGLNDDDKMLTGYSEEVDLADLLLASFYIHKEAQEWASEADEEDEEFDDDY